MPKEQGFISNKELQNGDDQEMVEDDQIMSFHSGSTKSSLGLTGDAKKQVADALINKRGQSKGRQDRQLT